MELKNLTIDAKDALNLINVLQKSFERGVASANEGNAPKFSPLAAYLLSKHAGYEITDSDGIPVQKSEVDETTLDFTRGRSLSEKDAEIAIRYVYDKSPYLKLFNTRIVKSLVTDVKGTAITSKNLVSNEQKGGAVTTINKRIVHNFGINMWLKNAQLHKDIPLQTVIDNLHNPNFENEVLNDVAIALGNDILNLAINGLGGNYASTEDFYDLNLGFNKMLQAADGSNTNTYGTIKVQGFLGRYLTPHKVDATGATGSDYTGVNLIAVMRKVYEAMPAEFRSDTGNVFMMSQRDVDLYVASRSDITNPSNPVKEDILTNGNVPRFMGHSLVAIPGWLSINETHESDSTLYGSILFGNPKNLDIASDSTSYRRDMFYNARAETGSAFEYTYNLYLDFQASRHNSFVIAFKGAKVSDPVLLSADDAKNGMNAYTPSATNTYKQTVASKTPLHVCCPTEGAVVVSSTDDLSGGSFDTLDEALAATAAAIIPENGHFSLATTDHIYLRAYHPNMIASDCIDCNITVS